MIVLLFIYPLGSTINIDYNVPKDGPAKKLYYNGNRMYMDVNLGEVTFFNSYGSKETYTAKRLELHFPSEHYITIKGQTPRQPLELQIHHDLKKTDNKDITNAKIAVNRAVISVLFSLGDLEEGDIFLNALGFNRIYNKL